MTIVLSLPSEQRRMAGIRAKWTRPGRVRSPRNIEIAATAACAFAHFQEQLRPTDASYYRGRLPTPRHLSHRMASGNRCRDQPFEQLGMDTARPGSSAHTIYARTVNLDENKGIRGVVLQIPETEIQ